MRDWTIRIKAHFKNKDFTFSVVTAFLFFLISFGINFIAGTYASNVASNSVTDVILSNTRVYDVDFLFTYGILILWIPIIFICLWHPKRIPFVLKSIALFIIIRAIFISITHIGPFPTHIDIVGNFNSIMNFTGDLFFSAHTGLPFLMALIFWQYKNIRYFCIACSIFFGTVVLLGHVHYSIDVLGAFFITYTIFHLAEILFKKDRSLFYSGIT
jgi:divalent metal cation (Fe/Co/Zn/Cd) transporter